MSLHGDFGISYGDVTEVMHNAGFPGFKKATLSLAENGHRTGVRLMPEGHAAVAARWPAYAAKLPGAPAKANRDKNRKLQHRFTFRTTEGFARRLDAVRKKMGFATMQEFLAHAMKDYVEKAEADIRRKERNDITWVKENVNESV